MTIHLKLDLNSPAELDAFGAFCASVAAARRADPPVIDQLYAKLGIDKAANPFWQTRKPGDVAAAPQPPVDNDHVAEGATAFTEAEIAANSPVILADAPTRERGKPSPGHKRRTNAEIAEDDAYEASLLKQAADLGTRVDNLEAAADAVAAISTGEERVGPEDDAATREQDAADEAAETAAATAERVAAGGSALTLDNVRNASAPYAKKFGVAAAAEDTRKLLGKPMIDLTEAEYAPAIEALNKLVAENTYGRPVVGEAAAPASVEVGKADVVAAMRRYALKFDGQDTDGKESAMPITTEDVKKCFGMRFGEGVEKLSHLKPEQYAQAVLDLDSMFAKNPWGRTPKVAS